MSYVNKGSMVATVTVSRTPDRSGNYICNGTADDVQLNAAATRLRGFGLGARATLVVKEGDYNTIAEVDFTNISVVMLGRIVVGAGYNGVGLKIGSGTPGSSFHNAVYELRVIRAATTSTAGNIGIQLINCVSSDISIFQADKFYWGIQFLGQGDGFAWNKITIGYIADNDNADLVLVNEDVNGDHGWVNKNLVLGGNFHSNATQNILFSYGDAGGLNDNTFISPDLSTNGIGIMFETGAYNIFKSVRSETPTYIATYVTSAADPHDNVIDITFGTIDVNDTISGGRNWIGRKNYRNILYEPLRVMYKGVFEEDFVGKTLRSTDIWQETFTGTGSGALLGTGFGKYRQTTGATINSTCLLNFNGVDCVRAYNVPRFKVGVELVETTNMEVSVYLRLDANNYMGFWYDENAGGASTWHARSVEGGVPTDVDTSIAPSGGQNLEVWVKSESKIEFRIDEQLVATITTNIDGGWMEPYLYLENTEALTKRVNYDYVTLEFMRVY